MKTRSIVFLFMFLCSIIFTSCLPSPESTTKQSQITFTISQSDTILPTQEVIVSPEITAQTKMEKEIYIYVKPGMGPVNVRECPRTSCEIIGKIEEGKKYSALGISEDTTWVMVNLPDNDSREGWVNLTLIQPESGVTLSELPLVSGSEMNIDEQDILVLQKYLNNPDLEIEFIGSGQSLNFPTIDINRYQINGVEYDIDIIDHQIVWIDMAKNLDPVERNGVVPQETLQESAMDLIAQLAPGLDINTYSLVASEKGENFFFRWQNSKGLYIQVGFDKYGNLLNYCNATGM